MRYRVKTTESLEFIIEGKDVDEVNEWLKCNTIREIRMANPKLNREFSQMIIEKTVMPADISTDICIEDIPDDDWNDRDTSWIYKDDENEYK